MTRDATLVVLTEDTGTSGWQPVVACVKALCDCLVQGIDWSRLHILPRADAPEAVLHAVGANRWKHSGKDGHDGQLNLARYLADQLMGEPEVPRFVFFHVDADRRWGEAAPDALENVKQFDRLVRNKVRHHLAAALAKKGRATELDVCMARLHLLVPYSAVEAWLYQNTEVAQRLCAERTCAGTHNVQYRAWADDRTRLDTIAQLKSRRDLHCLDDRDKLALARGLPHRAMYAAGRSFYAAVEAAGDDGALLHALIGRRPAPATL